MRVTISEGWAVVHEGKQVSSGELEVDDETGKHWVARGWAHEVKVVAKKAAPPRR